MRYIEINKDIVPYMFEIALEGETFQFDIRYNEFGDFWTVDLHKNQELIIQGEKLIYGSPLFGNYMHLDIPKVMILPYDTTDKSQRVGYEELEEDVFLFVVGDDDVDTTD